MSAINDGGPAFPMPSGQEPRVDQVTHYTLRDWFAGQALAGMLANPVGCKLIAEMAAEQRKDQSTLMALISYDFARAMISARKGGES